MRPLLTHVCSLVDVAGILENLALGLTLGSLGLGGILGGL
jgi:hypothetical protein